MLTKTKHSKVKEIMQTNVLAVYSNQSVFDASVLMASEGVGALPVIKDDKTLVGIITDRDIVLKCNAIGKDINRTKLQDNQWVKKEALLIEVAGLIFLNENWN